MAPPRVGDHAYSDRLTGPLSSGWCGGPGADHERKHEPGGETVTRGIDTRRPITEAPLNLTVSYPLPEFIEKLRRLADALENGRRFEIQTAGERISVPVRAVCNIEHERGEDEEEIEFQMKWSTRSAE